MTCQQLRNSEIGHAFCVWLLSCGEEKGSLSSVVVVRRHQMVAVQAKPGCGATRPPDNSPHARDEPADNTTLGWIGDLSRTFLVSISTLYPSLFHSQSRPFEGGVLSSTSIGISQPTTTTTPQKPPVTQPPAQGT